MKLPFSTLLALIAGFLGGFTSQLVIHEPIDTGVSSQPTPAADNNPFAIQSQPEPQSPSLESLLTHIARLEARLDELESQQGTETEHADDPVSPSQAMINRPVAPNQQNLVEAGISPDVAADMLRRMGEQEYRRLQLQNLISRSSGEVRRQYQNELRELNRNRLSLRSELGEETYDRYLYSSGQNNRMRVNSVLSGSPAETAGLGTGDIILRYDGKNIFNWADIRRISRQGDINNYTTIEILRDDTRMSLMVQRGPLGVQLEPARVDTQAQ